jgi:HEAT repeat protein
MRRTILAITLLGCAVLAPPAQAQKFLKKDVPTWVKELSTGVNEPGRRNAAFALGKLGGYAAEAVPALKRALERDSSYKVREAAAFALGEIGRDLKPGSDPELAPLLTSALKDDNWQVRRSAAFALGCLEGEAAKHQAALEALLRDPNPAVKQNAAWALGKAGPSAIPKLREALRDEDAFVKRDAVIALKSFEPAPVRAALGDLLFLCEDKDSEVRRAAVKELTRVVEPQDLKVALAILQGVLADRDLEIKRNAALALANIGGKETAAAVPILVDALRRGDLELRRQAAAGLRNIGEAAASAVPDLLQTLRDPDEELRKNSAFALGGIGPKAEKAVPALVALLTDPKEKPEPRMAAAVALSKDAIGPVPAAIDAVPRLTQLVANAGDDGNVRWRAIWALRAHGFNLQKMETVFPAFSKVLKEAKTEDNRMLRNDCAYMLARLQGRDAGEDVLTGLLDFLKDDKVQLYESTQATVQGGGQETGVGKATVKELGKGDGRVMATEALKAIGAARLRQRADIVEQLRLLAQDQNTATDLRKECQALLKDVGQ